MRSLLLGCVLLVACAPPIVAEDGGVDAGQVLPPTPVRIATFNVKLFFDSICQSGSCATGDFEQVLPPQAFDARATQLAQAIKGFDADMVALRQ